MKPQRDFQRNRYSGFRTIKMKFFSDCFQTTMSEEGVSLKSHQGSCSCQYVNALHDEECGIWGAISEPHTPRGDSADPEVCQDDEEELDHSSPLAPRKPGKRPFSLISQEAIEDDWELVEGDAAEPVLPRTPDLRWFFQQYELDEVSQVSICRTHANHLAAMSRVKRGGSTGARPVGRPRKSDIKK